MSTFAISKHYVITTKSFVIHDDAEDYSKDITRTERHITAGDYFGTLATILNLIKENQENILEQLTNIIEYNSQELEKLKQELMFLQDNYIIKKK